MVLLLAWRSCIAQQALASHTAVETSYVTGDGFVRTAVVSAAWHAVSVRRCCRHPLTRKGCRKLPASILIMNYTRPACRANNAVCLAYHEAMERHTLDHKSLLLSQGTVLQETLLQHVSRSLYAITRALFQLSEIGVESELGRTMSGVRRMWRVRLHAYKSL